MSDTAIRIENVRKMYKLGAIGGQTLNAELQSWWARKRGKEDPNLKIDQDYGNYGENFWALDGINLEVKKGEALGIIGGNGAGKSTLLKILSRVTAPTEGDIWINGRISSLLEVGTGFHGELTGRENIYMNGAILGMSKKEVDERIESIIDFSECRQFIDTPVKRYSSGMYVKLAFAVASHLDSEIMVMDEVLAVGDMKFQNRCLGKMGDEAKVGKTILYVSHNMATIRNLCSRCIVLSKGRIIFDGDVETAISIYSDGLGKSDLVRAIDCSDSKRRDYLGRKCHIDHFEFLDRAMPEYEANERMAISVDFSTLNKLNNVIGRIVIKTKEGEVIAMSESRVIREVDEGNHMIKFFFNTKNLPEGLYNLMFSLNEISEFAEYEMLDEIPEQIAFRIVEDEIMGTGKSKWISKYWGGIRLDAMEFEMD